MAHYINCENCMIRYEQEKHMFISNCSHILCKNCQPKQEICPVCKKTCKIKEINKDAGPLITGLFQEVSSDDVTKSTKFQIDKLLFQIQKRSNLIEKFEKTRRLCVKINESNKAFREAYNMEKELVLKLRALKARPSPSHLKSDPNLLKDSPKPPEVNSFNESSSPLSRPGKSYFRFSSSLIKRRLLF